MGRLFGRCPFCGSVEELFADGGTWMVPSREKRCQHCWGRSYENHGRPELPHDRGDARIVYQVDWIASKRQG